MTNKVFVCGVGMTKFEKPGAREDFDYPDMVKECVQQALDDAGLQYSEIQQAVCGYCYGDSTCGQRSLYQFGYTGIPIYNVNNNCATGSSALHMAKQLVESGIADCVLALGFEKMEKGSLGSKWFDRVNPIDKHVQSLCDTYGMEAKPMAPQLFGGAGREHMEKYGTTAEHFAKIAKKNHDHSVNNPRSQFRDKYSLDEIKNSRHVIGPLTKLQCCPTSDGGAAAVICSEAFMKSHGLDSKAVEVLALEMTTDNANFEEKPSMLKSVGMEMTKLAAQKAFQKANLTPNDVQVVELHDCFSTNELITYEGLGLCGEGQGGALVDNGDNTYGGKYVVNPSGGLISKGHPLGATGIAQCFELCSQLRGECDVRQVEGAVVGLQHNLGLGGACVVGLYKKLIPLASTTIAAVNTVESGFKSDALFSDIEKNFDGDRDAYMKKIKAVIGFELSGGPNNETGTWIIEAKKEGKIYRGTDSGIKTECVIRMTDDVCVRLLSGKLNAQTAFLQGKIKIVGNMGVAMKLQHLTKSLLKSKL